MREDMERLSLGSCSVVLHKLDLRRFKRRHEPASKERRDGELMQRAVKILEKTTYLEGKGEEPASSSKKRSNGLGNSSQVQGEKIMAWAVKTLEQTKYLSESESDGCREEKEEKEEVEENEEEQVEEMKEEDKQEVQEEEEEKENEEKGGGEQKEGVDERRKEETEVVGEYVEEKHLQAGENEEKIPEVRDEEDDDLQVGDEKEDALQEGDEKEDALQVGDEKEDALQVGDEKDDALQVGDEKEDALQVGDEKEDALQVGDEKEDDIHVEEDGKEGRMEVREDEVEEKILAGEERLETEEDEEEEKTHVEEEDEEDEDEEETVQVGEEKEEPREDEEEEDEMEEEQEEKPVRCEEMEEGEVEKESVEESKPEAKEDAEEMKEIEDEAKREVEESEAVKTDNEMEEEVEAKERTEELEEKVVMVPEVKRRGRRGRRKKEDKTRSSLITQVPFKKVSVALIRLTDQDIEQWSDPPAARRRSLRIRESLLNVKKPCPTPHTPSRRGGRGGRGGLKQRGLRRPRGGSLRFESRCPRPVEGCFPDESSSEESDTTDSEDSPEERTLVVKARSGLKVCLGSAVRGAGVGRLLHTRGRRSARHFKPQRFTPHFPHSGEPTSFGRKQDGRSMDQEERQKGKALVSQGETNSANLKARNIGLSEAKGIVPRLPVPSTQQQNMETEPPRPRLNSRDVNDLANKLLLRKVHSLQRLRMNACQRNADSALCKRKMLLDSPAVSPPTKCRLSGEKGDLDGRLYCSALDHRAARESIALASKVENDPPPPSLSSEDVTPAVPALDSQPAQPLRTAQPTHPSLPSQPVQPVLPIQSVHPSQSTHLAQPTRPSLPSQPAHPVQPHHPVQPPRSVQPSRPVQTVQPMPHDPPRPCTLPRVVETQTSAEPQSLKERLLSGISASVRHSSGEHSDPYLARNQPYASTSCTALKPGLEQDGTAKTMTNLNTWNQSYNPITNAGDSNNPNSMMKSMSCDIPDTNSSLSSPALTPNSSSLGYTAATKTPSPVGSVSTPKKLSTPSPLMSARCGTFNTPMNFPANDPQFSNVVATKSPSPNTSGQQKYASGMTSESPSPNTTIPQKYPSGNEYPVPCATPAASPAAIDCTAATTCSAPAASAPTTCALSPDASLQTSTSFDSSVSKRSHYSVTTPSPYYPSSPLQYSTSSYSTLGASQINPMTPIHSSANSSSWYSPYSSSAAAVSQTGHATATAYDAGYHQYGIGVPLKYPVPRAPVNSFGWPAASAYGAAYLGDSVTGQTGYSSGDASSTQPNSKSCSVPVTAHSKDPGTMPVERQTAGAMHKRRSSQYYSSVPAVAKDTSLRSPVGASSHTSTVTSASAASQLGDPTATMQAVYSSANVSTSLPVETPLFNTATPSSNSGQLVNPLGEAVCVAYSTPSLGDLITVQSGRLSVSAPETAQAEKSHHRYPLGNPMSPQPEHTSLASNPVRSEKSQHRYQISNPHALQSERASLKASSTLPIEKLQQRYPLGDSVTLPAEYSPATTPSSVQGDKPRHRLSVDDSIAMQGGHTPLSATNPAQSENLSHHVPASKPMKDQVPASANTYGGVLPCNSPVSSPESSLPRVPYAFHSGYDTSSASLKSSSQNALHTDYNQYSVSSTPSSFSQLMSLQCGQTDGTRKQSQSAMQYSPYAVQQQQPPYASLNFPSQNNPYAGYYGVPLQNAPFTGYNGVPLQNTPYSSYNGFNSLQLWQSQNKMDDGKDKSSCKKSKRSANEQMLMPL